MKLGYNLCRHFKSFVGRDFKALAQVVLFILGRYMTPEEKSVWLALSKVCYMLVHMGISMFFTISMGIYYAMCNYIIIILVTFYLCV